MAEEESSLEPFINHIEAHLKSLLDKFEKRISNALKRDDIEDVLDIAAEANSLINFYCGEDDQLYDEMRYRVFFDAHNDKIMVIRASECDVDFRNWIENGDITEWNDGEDLEDDFEDDNDDFLGDDFTDDF